MVFLNENRQAFHAPCRSRFNFHGHDPGILFNQVINFGCAAFCPSAPVIDFCFCVGRLIGYQLRHRQQFAHPRWHRQHYWRGAEVQPGKCGRRHLACLIKRGHGRQSHCCGQPYRRQPDVQCPDRATGRLLYVESAQRLWQQRRTAYRQPARKTGSQLRQKSQLIISTGPAGQTHQNFH